MQRVILSPERELDRILTLEEASQVSTVSVDGLKRHHADKIVQLTPGRFGMRLRHALMLTTN
jgi:hypothetical protein